MKVCSADSGESCSSGSPWKAPLFSVSAVIKQNILILWGWGESVNRLFQHRGDAGLVRSSLQCFQRMGWLFWGVLPTNWRSKEELWKYSEQRQSGKLCVQPDHQNKVGHGFPVCTQHGLQSKLGRGFPVLPINFLWWTVQRQLQPNNTPLAWTGNTLEFSPISLTSFGCILLHRAQHTSPYMVMLGSTTWIRSRKASKAKGYSCLSPGFSSCVLSTVDSIES